MKLIDVRHDDIPDNNNPYNKISIPIGDRLINVTGLFLDILLQALLRIQA